MDNAQGNPPPLPETGPPAVPRWATWTARLVLAAAVLAGGGWISHHWLTNRPKATRRRPKPQATLVEVNEVSRQSRRAVVRAMGTVVPAQQIQLASQVSGRVVEVSPEFVPGGRLQAGKRVLRVEPSDYQLTVRQRASDLARARSELKLEMGRQAVARREYELLGKDISAEDRELLLRKPQLAAAKAAVSAAEAALERAKLDLARAEVLAPFNATVQSRNVELGSHVNVGAPLASVVGTDEYWVQVSVPADELRWIEVPGPDGQGGSEVRVYWEAAWGPKRSRPGTVRRLMTNLEPQGRMAQLLVAVHDPLDLQGPANKRCPLILDSCVRVEIDGRELTNVVRVPRAALREGCRVWVMTADGKLEVREVEITLSGDEEVYVGEGLAAGDRLITSDLGTPVPGMALRTAETATLAPTAAEDGTAADGERGAAQ